MTVVMHSPTPPAAPPTEVAEYLTSASELVYCVLHEAVGSRRGMALVAGPFGAERERAYLTLVHWARRLAARGFDVLRFDYRGNGESTGRFEQMTLSHWRNDLVECFHRLRERDAEAPIVIHGVRMGAVLASEVFDAGMGDALLMWGPPAGGREHLSELLRRHLMAELAAAPDAPRKTREDFLAEIEAGNLLNVDGYFWSRALVNDAASHPLRRPANSLRPWHAIDVKPPAQPPTELADLTGPPPNLIRADRPWDASGMIVPDNTMLFNVSLQWLDTAQAAFAPEGGRIVTRHVLSIDVPKGRLHGTVHLPRLIDDSGVAVAGPTPHRIGALILNPGPAPRAGNSDLSVHLCDALAESGFLAFRFDLPGVGDSPGEVPLEVESYWSEVLAGRNDVPTLDLLSEIRRQFNLDGLVVGGLLRGAVTAIRCADIDERGIAGLLLMEPNFRRLAVSSPQAEAAEMRRAGDITVRSRLRQVLSLRRWLYFLTGDSAAAQLCWPIRPFLLRAMERVIGHSLPPEANLPMVMAWRRVMRLGVPTLVLTAKGKIEEHYCLRILDSVPQIVAKDVFIEGIPHTNHIFTAGNAREHAIRAVGAWARQEFAGDNQRGTTTSRSSRARAAERRKNANQVHSMAASVEAPGVR